MVDDFRQQLMHVVDTLLAAGAEPIFLVCDLEGVKELKAAHGQESFDKFRQATVDAVVGATHGADAFTYGEEQVVVILDGREYDRLRTFALIQRLRKAIPLLGQSFDCFLRPDFDVLEYRPNDGVAAVISQLANVRTARKERERQIA
jgi:GGDEF domain-containing protein